VPHVEAAWPWLLPRRSCSSRKASGRFHYFIGQLASRIRRHHAAVMRELNVLFWCDCRLDGFRGMARTPSASRCGVPRRCLPRRNPPRESLIPEGALISSRKGANRPAITQSRARALAPKPRASENLGRQHYSQTRNHPPPNHRARLHSITNPVHATAACRSPSEAPKCFQRAHE
jgi:hypothetical protein